MLRVIVAPRTGDNSSFLFLVLCRASRGFPLGLRCRVLICGGLRPLRERLQRACFAIECSLVLRVRIFRAVPGRSGPGSSQGPRNAAGCSTAGFWRGWPLPQRVFLLEGRELIRGKSNSSARTLCTGGTAQVIVRLWVHSIIYSVSTTTEATSLISLEIDVKISLNLGSPGQAVAGTALSILGTALEIAGFGTPLTTY